jgi:hypothetical protein
LFAVEKPPKALPPVLDEPNALGVENADIAERRLSSGQTMARLENVEVKENALNARSRVEFLSETQEYDAVSSCLQNPRESAIA